MSQTCSNCGTLNLDSYRFCSNCGAPLGPDGQATQPINPPAPPVTAPDTGSSNNMEQPAPTTSPVSFEPAEAQPAQPTAAPSQEEKRPLFSYESVSPFNYDPPPTAPAEDDKLSYTPFESSQNAPERSENISPESYYAPSPSGQESAVTASTPEQPASEPAYVVKTSPDSISFGSPAPTTPASGFETPTPPPMPQSQYPGMSIPNQQGPSTQPPTMQYPGYQGYNQGASATPNANTNPNNTNSEGGVYAPYTAGSTAALERPNEPRSWLIPVIVVAALLLVGLVALAIFTNRQSGLNPGTANNTPLPGVSSQASPAPTVKSSTPNKPAPTATQLPANASEEDRVRAVIHNSNDQQIKAWKELNPDYLSDNYIGPALEENIQQVQQLRQLNLFAIPSYSKLDILSVNLVDDNTATVKTTEVWTVTYYDRATSNKTRSDGPTTYNETYHLVKQGGKWLINKLDIETNAPATPTRSGT